MMKHMMDFQDVLDHATVLKSNANLADRRRIRDVMNGGAAGVQAVLNHNLPKTGGPSSPTGLGVDLPTANVMYSGLERMAQKIGREPTLKTDLIPTKDTGPARKAAEKRARIVSAWDDMDKMEMQYPQMGRWLPGYGITAQVIKDRKFGDEFYPVAELRDPMDVFHGEWGPNQEPLEMAIFRATSKRNLMRSYPYIKEKFEETEMKRRGRSMGGAVLLGASKGQNWEGSPHRPVEVIEYYCSEGTWIACPEMGMIIDYIPNPLESGPAFVINKRFSFDQLQGHFHHVFGLMAMMGKLNILGLIGVEDSTFRETNIFGEMVGKTYKRGRMAVNKFEHGTRVEKPTSDQLQQTWQAINILERQFRVVAGYDVAQDGESPNSFATGQGIRELGASASENVREYQTVMRHGAELVDRKRLEWEDVMSASKKKKVYWYEGSKRNEETYVPNKAIAGDYRTKRIYGAMATFDENSKIVTGLQLLQANIIDRVTLQENLDGIHNVSLINERIDQNMAKEMMMQGLGQRFGEQDPAAALALTEILDQPKNTVETLKKLFTPQEPEMSPEEEAMMAAGGMGGGPPAPGAPGGGGGMPGAMPPPVQTILAQMETESGGAMTVGRTA